ncbi:MAG: transcription-repair coupling factor [Chloroflexi bacterium]|nr:transcription-repair coupling factor [Chloroflexota bacterium]
MNLTKLLPTIADACRLSALRERLESTREPLVLGAPDAAKAAIVAALIREATAPTLVVVPKLPQALALIEELTAWLDGSVLHFPERDALPYERVPPDAETLRDRLQTLQALAGGNPCVIVTSAVALAQRTLPLDAAANLELRAGERTTPDTLATSLLQLGYRNAPVVTLPGETARRGGIVDVFPATDDQPVRIEFLGDQIESMRRFDAESQRSSPPPGLETLTLGPALEAVDLPAATATLAGQIDLSGCDAAVRERYEEELEQLQAGEATDAESFYLPFIASGSLLDHLPDSALLVLDEPADIAAALDEHDSQTDEVRRTLEEQGELPAGLPSPHTPSEELQQQLRGLPRSIHLSRWAGDSQEAQTEPNEPDAAGSDAHRLPFAPPDVYGGRLRALTAGVAEATARGRALVIVSQQAERVAELMEEDGVAATISSEPAAPQAGVATIVHGSLPHGWRLTTSQPPLTLLTDAEVFGFVKQRRRLPRAATGGREAFVSELSPGDYVVHIEHGIARFSGLVQRQVDGIEHEYLELRYAQGDRLFVPAEQVDRLSRYVGPSDHTPGLTRLGSQEWSRAKDRVRRAVADLAKELLELYASRELTTGRAFSPDGAWQQELEASFPYVETADQLAAVRAVKEDMERDRPMDRLVCGDVGYGKTEVAIRAAFKTVMDGAQVAVLVPTTVLAKQHDTTFRERLAGFPVRVEMLSRFRSDREQREIVAALADGSVDIVIGTHRLLQKDVRFKDLGLVIIDEEQRFGVANKERLKQMRRQVDVLTLSATPIPRTLHMSLSGIRDMSTMETPPEQRLPIKTYVSEFDDHLVREAILRELERGGQVYVVHNRVLDIERVTAHLRELVPEAEILIGHGQQPEEVLERAMLDFVEGRADVLVCTTIIESGLDIPNVNTIIIDKADKLGLAQLYQLRGRVGRGAVRAYAYLLFDRYRSLSETAQKRLQAIFEATELGAGFQIAMRDLEIRGAGNLLGAEQSGHIGSVGFDLYVRLLADAVERLKALREGRPQPTPKAQQRPLTIDLPFTAHLPASYVGDLNLRLALYQRMAAVTTLDGVDELAQELRDRFGPPPPAVENLLFAVRIRALSLAADITGIQQVGHELVVQTGGGAPPRERLQRLSPSIKGLRAGPAQARLDLEELGEAWPEALLDVVTTLAETSISAAPASK